MTPTVAIEHLNHGRCNITIKCCCGCTLLTAHNGLYGAWLKEVGKIKCECTDCCDGSGAQLCIGPKGLDVEQLPTPS